MKWILLGKHEVDSAQLRLSKARRLASLLIERRPRPAYRAADFALVALLDVPSTNLGRPL